MKLKKKFPHQCSNYGGRVISLIVYVRRLRLGELVDQSSVKSMFFTAVLYWKFHSKLCSTYKIGFELMRFY